MFRHPAWAVGSYSSGPPAAGTVATKSTGGFYRSDVSPCKLSPRVSCFFLPTGLGPDYEEDGDDEYYDEDEDEYDEDDDDDENEYYEDDEEEDSEGMVARWL